MSKKILVLGGTGAMGTYLVPELLKMGYQVHVVSLDKMASNDPNLTYLTANATDLNCLAELLKPHYDAIVDFLIYNTVSFRARYKLFLENTDQYVYLSSYRIYADSKTPIKETSDRLLDVSTDTAFTATEDYSLYKARGEDDLRNSGMTNWTAIRPAITYSKRKFQLVTLEAPIHVYRARTNRRVLLPEDALDIQGTMSWGGDVAKMIARLLFNPRAYGEIFTVATAEHHSWGEIAKYYEEIHGMKYTTVDTDTYIELLSGDAHMPWARYQLIYDRYFNRVMDNSKILDVAQMRQQDLMPLKQGLQMELANLPKDYSWGETEANARMDAYLMEHFGKLD